MEEEEEEEEVDKHNEVVEDSKVVEKEKEVVGQEGREGRSEEGAKGWRSQGNVDLSMKSQVRKRKARARQAMEEKLASAMVKEVEAALATTKRTSTRNREGRVRRVSWQQVP